MRNNRIVFVGHSINSPFAPAIITNLRVLGYEVTFFDQFRPDPFTKVLGVLKNTLHNNSAFLESQLNSSINQALIKLIRKINPAYIFLFKGKNITPSTITVLRNKGYTVLNWYPDYYDDWDWIKTHAGTYDYFFTPCLYVQKKLKEIGITSYYLPFAAQADKKLISTPKKYNATFVGRFTLRREKLFKKVLNAGLLNIWGYPHWQNTPYRSAYHGQINPEECITIIRQSRITLNTLTATDNVPITSVNYRVFEASGVGGFVLSWYNYPLEEFFRLGREIATFTSSQEALEKTKYYLNHDSAREKIAKDGWERTKKDHTYQKRLQQLFSFIK